MKRANNQETSVRSLVFAFTVLSAAAVCLWLVAGMNRTEAQQTTDETTVQSVSPAATFTANPASLGAIPDGAGNGPRNYGAARDVTFSVTGITGNVSNVSVSFNASHTWVGDLNVVLKAPGGTPSHIIFSETGIPPNTGGYGSELSSANVYTFNDAASVNWWTAANIGQGVVIPGGSYRTTQAGITGGPNPAPVTNMNAAFSSVSNANGIWTLSLRDGWVGDTGSVTAASLTIDGGGTPPKPCYDFFGTGRTSFGIFNAEGNFWVWRMFSNPASSYEGVGYGQPTTDTPTPGYYDNDNKADIGVWRPTTATAQANFYYRQSTLGNPTAVTQVPWGIGADFVGYQADYDADGRDDFTALRRVSGVWQWYIMRSSNNTFLGTAFGFGNGAANELPGQNGVEDIPLAGADYNGDGRADLTVLRQNASGPETYLIADAVSGNIILSQIWGEFDTDFFIIGDYVGDSRADFVTWRGFGTGLDGRWYIRENGGTGQTIATQFGIPGPNQTTGDRPICGDYDGNGKSDIAVYRRSNKTFYWLTNPTNPATGGQFTFTTPPNTGAISGEFAIGQLKTF